MMKRILWMALAMLTTVCMHTNAKEREITLWGHVRDAFTKVGIMDAKVTLMRSDSTIVDTTTVGHNQNFLSSNDTWYRFMIPVEKQTYIIKVTHPNYEDCYINYSVKYTARNTYLDAPWHYMKKKVAYHQDLKEVVVKASKIKMVYRGDTVVYNADAFNLPQGSMLDELIRQLPGVELKDNGDITVNGRHVDFLTLNGKDFFRGKNKVMLDNLPYYTVQNVKVYDKSTEKSKFYGKDVEQKDYVMDVQLKREYSKGYMGNAEGGLGTEDRYMTRAFGLGYNDHNRLSLYGNMNNVNENRRPGSNGEWTPSESYNGQNSTKSIGGNYMYDKEGIKDEAWASMEGHDNDFSSRQTRINYLNTGNTFGLSRSSNRNKTFGISAANQLSINKITAKLPYRLVLNSGYNFNHQESNGSTQGATLSKDPSTGSGTDIMLDSIFSLWNDERRAQRGLVNRTFNSNSFSSYSYNIYQSVNLSLKLPTGDDLDLHTEGSYNHENNERNIIYQLDYQGTPSTTDYRNQLRSKRYREYFYNLQAVYTFHLPNKWNIAPFVQYNQTRNNNDLPLYRIDQNRPDSANSESSNYMDKKLHSGIRFYYERSSDDDYLWINIYLPVDYRYEHEHYRRDVIDTSYAIRNWIFHPNANFQWFTHGRNRLVEMHYSMGYDTPYLSELVNYHDDSDPLSQRIGNPHLKNSYYHHIDAYYRNTVPKWQQNLSFKIVWNLRDNSIINNYTYIPSSGAYIYQPVNISGSWDISSNVLFNRALDADRHWTIEASNDLSHRHNPYVIAGQRFTSDINAMAVNLGVTYQKGDLTATLKGIYQLKHSSGTSATYQSQTLQCDNYTATLKYKLPLGIMLATDFKIYTIHGVNDEALNRSFYLWNASLSRNFCKNKLTAKLEGFDLLKDISGINVDMDNGTYATTWRSCLSHYVMLHLSYHFSIMPKNKK